MTLYLDWACNPVVQSTTEQIGLYCWQLVGLRCAGKVHPWYTIYRIQELDAGSRYHVR